MKKFLTLIICFTYSFLVYSQASDDLTGFWGIPFGSSKSFCVEKLKSKGVVDIESKSDGHITRLTADGVTFSNKKCENFCLRFVDDKLFSALLIYETKTPNIKDDFNEMFENINKKYLIGKKSSDFKYPYKEGDDDEEFALGYGYGRLIGYWFFTSATISLETKHLTSLDILKLEYQDNALTQKAISYANNDY